MSLFFLLVLVLLGAMTAFGHTADSRDAAYSLRLPGRRRADRPAR